MNFKKEIEKAILIREVERSLIDLFNSGKQNCKDHTCIGQELNGVFVSKYLNSNDHVVSNHRGHGHYLSRFDDIKGLISELMGKTSGCSGGIGGSQHIVNKNYLSNGIQGGMVPIAAGIALFNKNTKSNSISVAYIGDGTLGEGIIYETFNIAAKQNLPLLIVMENNEMAQSTSFYQTFSGDIEKRILGFGLDYYCTNTNDISDLDSKCMMAINKVRNFNVPVFLEIKTNRLYSHSKGDDNRDLKKINDLKEQDIISKIYESNDKYFLDYIKNTKAKINKIILQANNSETLTDYKVDFSKKLFGLQKLKEVNIEKLSNGRYNTLINDALDSFLANNDNSIILGEDIEDSNEYNPGDYGGAFKVTKKLSIKYKGRVYNTPISEAAITGIGSGYCLAGGDAIVEIMFGDFMTLIFDQILQHATKFEQMFNGQVKCPLIVRTPMGGKRGYGPTHSQSIEKFFIGIPNLCIVALNHRISPEYVYKAIKKFNSSPTIIIENKILYTLNSNTPKLPDHSYEFNNFLFPDLIIYPKDENPLVTVICYGEVLNDLEKAYYDLILEDEIFIEIICPSLISPINCDSILNSVKKTQKLLIIEEGIGEASWGSEIVSKLVLEGVKINKLHRINNNLLIPSSYTAELNNISNPDLIKKYIKLF